jgi:DNA-binding transcriptional LysR family regulator
VVPYPLLLPQSGTTRTRLDRWLEPVQNQLRISMELDSSEMMKRFVMAGLGITFLATANCREEIEAGTVHAISLAPDPMIRRTGLVYRKDKALSKAALGFIDTTLAHFGAASGELAAREKEAG